MMFKFMSNQKPIWDINENKYLCLCSLPTISIFIKYKTLLNHLKDF
jgi:hypothetical protein